MFIRNGILIERKFKQYLFSTILMSMALSLGAIVDGVLASEFLGTEALAAINLCQPLIFVFGALYSVFGAGGSTLTATAMGKCEKDKAECYFTTTMVTLAFLGILITAALLPSIRFLINIITFGSSLAGMAGEYLSTLIWGSVVLFVVPGFAFFIRTDGSPGFAAAILVIANVVNLVCDVIFMGFMELGMTGAALATITGYTAGLIAVVVYFVRGKCSLRLSLKGFKLGYVADTLICGLPNALNSVLMTVKMFCLNNIAIALLGDYGATIAAICNNCSSFAAIFISGASQTMLPIIAVLYGENDKNGMIKAFETAVHFVLTAGTIVLVVFEMFPGTIMNIFNVTSPELLKISVLAVRLFGFSLPIFALSYVYMSYYQATAKRLFAMAITCCEGLLFIVPLMFLLSKLLPANGMGLWLSFVASEILALAMIFSVSFIISRRTGKESILLFEPDNDASFDVTIKTTIDDVVEVSKQVIEFCKKHGVDTKKANVSGVAIEEMLSNIVTYGYKNNPDEDIDLIMKLQKDNIIIRIRDEGKPFDSMDYRGKNNEELKFSGIELLRKITKSAEYTRTLGFNNLVIKI